MSIYDIPSIDKIVYFDSFTGKNITSGSFMLVIWPFNRLSFSEECFMPSGVYAGAHEITEDTSETTEGSISHLNSRED